MMNTDTAVVISYINRIRYRIIPGIHLPDTTYCTLPYHPSNLKRRKDFLSLPGTVLLESLQYVYVVLCRERWAVALCCGSATLLSINSKREFEREDRTYD